MSYLNGSKGENKITIEQEKELRQGFGLEKLERVGIPLQGSKRPTIY